jgi:hypothetical protein
MILVWLYEADSAAIGNDLHWDISSEVSAFFLDRLFA